MSSFEGKEALDQLLAKLEAANWRDRESVKDELLACAQAAKAAVEGSVVDDYLEQAAKGMSNLEVRWEIEEVLEGLQPVVTEEEAPAEEETAEEEPADGKLRMSDMDLQYDDPRGLQLYKHKTQERWFAVQTDPTTGQPRMFELHPTEVTQLRAQLQGSPYWMLGAGS